MSVNKILKLAKEFEDKLDKSVVIEEHEVDPISYMAFSNLENIIDESKELLSIMNDKDDLPQWTDELLALAKNNISKVLDYVRSQKIKTASKKCSKCKDVHCCMNYAATHTGDINDAKCEGTKHSPVGSPRQRAFCARHCGMKKKRTSKAVANDPDSCINKGLRRWKCRCG